MFRVGAIDCHDTAALCKKLDVDTTILPYFRVLPPTPIPAQDYKPEGEIDTDKLKKMAYRYIGNNTVEITQTNFDTFKDDRVATPNLLLFTEKKGTPIVYRALSTYFSKTLDFGVVRKSDAFLIKKFKIEKFPTFVLLKNKEKPNYYNGGSFTYQDLFEFINVYSETFVFGKDDGKDEGPKAASKPWLNEPLPFLNKDSGNDLCLVKDGTLCVMYVVPNAAASDQTVIDALQTVKVDFVANTESRIRFSFMRLDMSAEPELSKALKLSDTP